jgi:hypothetical protein
MNDTPENKQKRLMSLNQDVLAVSPGATSTHQAVRPPREGTRQRVTETREEPVAQTRGRGVAAALGVLSVVMLVLLGIVSMMLLTMQKQVDALQQQIATPAMSVDVEAINARIATVERQFAPIDARLTTLEEQPVIVQAPESPRGTGDAASQAGLAQVNARLRRLDIETSRIATDLGSIKQDVSGVLARAQRVETLANSQRDALATLTPRVDALASALSGADQSTRLSELEGRLERTNNDIRNLYRMLEMGR